MAASVGATYRLQLSAGRGFREAAGLAPYLATLGVTHLYASPYLQAAPGSTHGYDVVDPRRVSAELGGEEGHRRMCAALEEQGLGQLLDVVPNHMAVSGPENPWWWDVLENGASSRYAAYFDVEWTRTGGGEGTPEGEGERADAILLPVLDTHYGRVLEAGRIRLVREGGAFTVRFEDHRFPVSPRSLGTLLGRAAYEEEAAGVDEGEESPPGAAELAFLADACAELPVSPVPDPELAERRHRDKRVLERYLETLLARDEAAARAVDRVVERWNAHPADLDPFLEDQNYRLAFWRLADAELPYRRFFHINELVALRSEDERVFRATHRRILRWLGEGVLDGVRVDHPDGLRDPEQYFRRLRRAAPDAWIVAEKILEPGEELRESWEAEGTTGYDFLNRAGGLFVDPTGEGPLTELYADFTGESTDYPALARSQKRLAVERLLGSDLNRLTDLFRRVCLRHPRHRDYARRELRAALAEVAACFPVYRSYVRAETGEVAPEDAEAVEVAVRAAAERRPDLSPDPLDFLRDLLLLRVPGSVEGELVMRFQQLTGPVMAKGVEDTAFYIFNRLVSLNEVGGDPGRFGVSVEAFHRESARGQERRPRTLLATSSHDTKRSEDVRARLHLLSEIPERWGEAVRRWSRRNERHRTERAGRRWPDRNAEYLLYQTLVGAWPIGEDRLLPFLEKAAREAKVHTTWTEPDPAYEEALAGFARAVLADPEFRGDLEGFVRPLVEPGRVNSLGQTLIKLTAPGVPDLYQGCELWDLSLVDPDNRRPVDFEGRRRLLEEIVGPELPDPRDLLARSDEGLPKLHVVHRTLSLRRERPRAFGPDGGYRPVEAVGARADHVVAFVRGGEAVTVVPRLVLGLGGWRGPEAERPPAEGAGERGAPWVPEWDDTTLELPDGAWEDRITGEGHRGGAARLSDLLGRFPVALLARSSR